MTHFFNPYNLNQLLCTATQVTERPCGTCTKRTASLLRCGEQNSTGLRTVSAGALHKIYSTTCRDTANWRCDDQATLVLFLSCWQHGTTGSQVPCRWARSTDYL
jgi:hypothetical protein